MSTSKNSFPAFDNIDPDIFKSDTQPIQEMLMESIMAAAMRGEIVRLVYDGKTIAVLDASGLLAPGTGLPTLRFDESCPSTAEFPGRTEQNT